VREKRIGIRELKSTLLERLCWRPHRSNGFQGALELRLPIAGGMLG
jgi:hypothetical protein